MKFGRKHQQANTTRESITPRPSLHDVESTGRFAFPRRWTGLLRKVISYIDLHYTTGQPRGKRFLPLPPATSGVKQELPSAPAGFRHQYVHVKNLHT